MTRALHRPVLGDEELAAVAQVLESGHLVQGPQVERFEASLASILSVDHAMAVTSGTAALHVSVLALGATAHDEVIVPAFGFPATANAVELTGARARLADVDPDTFALTVDSVRQAGTERTTGVILVHPFGIPGPTGAIREFCDSQGWWLLEDAACALGTAQEDRWGSGDVPLCLSFHPRKTITTGEGGLVATNDPDLARSIRMLRNHGMAPDATGWRRFEVAGFNYRMSDLAAAIGLVQLGRLTDIVDHRRRIAGLYREALQTVSGVRWPRGYDQPSLSYQSVVVELDEQVNRDGVIAHLSRAGVQTTLGGYDLSDQPYYAERYGLRPGDFPWAQRLAEQSLTLPVTIEMERTDVQDVVGDLVRAMEGK
jgi:dTDP-4-amino-4,6-dideoxygalactose transaminase